MHFIRTIQKSEKFDWVEKLFRVGPHPDPNDSPFYPPEWPLPFTPSHALVGSFSYLLYDGSIVGFQRVARVERSHGPGHVGSQGSRVKPGTRVVLEREYERAPEALSGIPVVGFHGVRYTEVDLHRVGRERAIAALRAAKVPVLAPSTRGR